MVGLVGICKDSGKHIKWRERERESRDVSSVGQSCHSDETVNTIGKGELGVASPISHHENNSESDRASQLSHVHWISE